MTTSPIIWIDLSKDQPSLVATQCCEFIDIGGYKKEVWCSVVLPLKGCHNIFGSAWYDEKFAFYDANLSRYPFKENGVKHIFVSHDFNKNAIKPSAKVGTSSSSDPKPSTRLHEPHEELHAELGKQPLAPVTTDSSETTIVGVELNTTEVCESITTKSSTPPSIDVVPLDSMDSTSMSTMNKSGKLVDDSLLSS